jgi:hypothetical protein
MDSSSIVGSMFSAILAGQEVFLAILAGQEFALCLFKPE